MRNHLTLCAYFFFYKEIIKCDISHVYTLAVEYCRVLHTKHNKKRRGTIFWGGGFGGSQRVMSHVAGDSITKREREK